VKELDQKNGNENEKCTALKERLICEEKQSRDGDSVFIILRGKRGEEVRFGL